MTEYKGLIFTLICLLSVYCGQSIAHSKVESKHSELIYLGNEGILIKKGKTKILFDPFFHNDYGVYQLVPDDIKRAILNGQAPYDQISLLLISHAHEDHFSVDIVLSYLAKHPNVVLIAPEQAIEQLEALGLAKSIRSRIVEINLEYGEDAKQVKVSGLNVEAIRIAHAGWPARKEVQNLVYRVTLENELTVMHMGDADPQMEHFEPYQKHWLAKRTDTAFPPYWFYSSPQGIKILQETINSKKSIGIHVPKKVPESLIRSGFDYLSIPGELRNIQENKR